MKVMILHRFIGSQTEYITQLLDFCQSDKWEMLFQYSFKDIFTLWPRNLTLEIHSLDAHVYGAIYLYTTLVFTNRELVK